MPIPRPHSTRAYSRRKTLRALALCVLLVPFATACVKSLDRPVASDAVREQESFEAKRLRLVNHLDREARVWEIASRVRRANAALCHDTDAYDFGVLAVSREAFDDLPESFLAEVGLGPGVRVWRTFDEGRLTHLTQNDRIVEVNGDPVKDLEAFRKSMKKARKKDTLTVGIQDGETVRQQEISGVPACQDQVLVSHRFEVNAFADGDNVVVTTGMTRFVEDDDELAIVIGHELAHNALGHVSARRAKMAAGAVLDLAVAVFTGVATNAFTNLGAVAFSKRDESDADYMGLYFAARAGYEIDRAPEFWRRMAAEEPAGRSGSMLSTHPASDKRAADLRAAVKEIQAKRLANEPLLPRGSIDVAAKAETRQPKRRTR